MRGRKMATEAARAHGFDIRRLARQRLFSAARNRRWRDTTHGAAHRDTRRTLSNRARLSPATGVYLALALGTIGIAGALGFRLSRAFSDDV